MLNTTRPTERAAPGRVVGPATPRRPPVPAGRADADGRLFQPPAWTWRRAGGVGWWVAPGWLDTLLGPGGLRLAEWAAAGRLRTVKTGPHRVVYRAELPEGAVYIKHFKVPGWREMVRQWIRRGKGRNEAKRARILARAGIPTIRPIALGEQRHRGFLFENYLISPEIAGTVSLDEFVEVRLGQMPPGRAARVRRALAVESARLTARLHDAGFVHQDFHPGNLLVRLEGDAGIALTMIDLDALRVRRHVSWRAARMNLALLNHYFWLRCGRADRHRFVRAYLEARQTRPIDPGRFARSVERATRAWAERLWRRWGRRCRRSNKYFRVYRNPTSWAVASRVLDKATVRAVLADPEALLRGPGARLLKDSRTTTVSAQTLTVEGRPALVIVKRFHCKKRLDPLFAVFRPTRGWRAWQAGQHLACRGVPTPQNLLYIRRTGRRAWWRPWSFLPRETYLVTRKAEPAITLAEYLRGPLVDRPPKARRLEFERLLRALAALIRTLHERSLAHRDLKAANILIVGDPGAERPRLSLIDLVGVALHNPLPMGRRVQNLARLALSLEAAPGRTRTDALRFLMHYLPHADRRAWRALWRAVERAAGAKRARNRRNGRILS